VEQEERDLEHVENSSYNSSNDEPEGRTFAELVSHVSHHWRAVALDAAVLVCNVTAPAFEFTGRQSPSFSGLRLISQTHPRMSTLAS
jgi:hypothetical protein